LHLCIFDQPGKTSFFNNLLEQRKAEDN